MYSDKLEALISSAIADGKITEKERKVLHNIAQQEGVDTDEIDLYIDGQLELKKSNANSSTTNQLDKVEGKKVLFGLANKLNAIENNVNNVLTKVASNISKERIEEVEDIGLALLDEFDQVSEWKQKKKANAIEKLIVPSTKEDLLDFTISLLPLVNKRHDESTEIIGNAYYSKLLECETRIRIKFSNDPDFTYILGQIKKEKKKLSLHAKNTWNGILLGVSLVSINALMIWGIVELIKWLIS